MEPTLDARLAPPWPAPPSTPTCPTTRSTPTATSAYPITAPTWILVYTTQTDKAKGEALKGFLTYILTDGQDLAAAVDYAKLPDSLQGQGAGPGRPDRRSRRRNPGDSHSRPST